MDTRFWGPDGWTLLHSIAEGYPLKPSIEDIETYKIFFKTIEYVLPCIYCRRSFKEYIENIPIEHYLKNKKSLQKWLYLIHNRVNNKLRKQGLNSSADPTLVEITKRYEHYVKDINRTNCIGMPGWNFLYSIVFNFPLNHPVSEMETDRLMQHIIFFKYLAKVLPFDSVKKKYAQYVSVTNFEHELISRTRFKKWFYNIERSVKKMIHCKCLKYNDLCNKIETHRAGCDGKNDKKPTCRVGNSN